MEGPIFFTISTKMPITPMSFGQIEKFQCLKSFTTQGSRAFMWYLQNPRVHMSRVQKHVSKLVNFKVQKVQKPELFDFTDTCPWSGDVMPSFCHTPYLWAIFLTNITQVSAAATPSDHPSAKSFCLHYYPG